MRFFKCLFISLLLLSVLSCDAPNNTEKTILFDYVLPNTSFVIKVNKEHVLQQSNPLVVDLYLKDDDKNFLSQIGYKKPFIINVFQNNSRLKGFVSVGKLAKIDSVFDRTDATYDNFPIYKHDFKQQKYYATQINDLTFISNQKLFIENSIRDRDYFGKLTQNTSFSKGVKSLDNNAEINFIIMAGNFKPDQLFHSSFLIKYSDIADWQFIDLVEVSKSVASGIGIKKDTIGVLNQIFSGIKPKFQNFSNLMPFVLNEAIILSFNDYKKLHRHLQQQVFFTPKQANNNSIFESLKGISFFREGQNQAVILNLADYSTLTGEEPEKIKEFNNYDIYKYEHSDIINNSFSGVLPTVKVNYYSIIEGQVLMTETQSYLEKVLNDIQNHAVLSNSNTYQKLKSEIPDNYHLIFFKNKLKIANQSYMKIQTFKVDDNFLFTNLVLKRLKGNSENGMIEQVLSYNLKDIPIINPKLVYNHKTKQYDIIYQDEQKRLTLINLKGKRLWQTKLKDKVIGDIQQVDLFRNRKLQYTFVTPHHWYVVDRLGRMVDDFPEHFMQKITQGISVFDYDKNRKYRFGITQSDKFLLYDDKAKKVKGFKFKTKEDIIRSPQHFRIGSKDFIVMQDADGKLYLISRRGEERIKMSEKFKTTRNKWGVYNHKFVNIDDDDRIIAIDLSGKLKSGNPGLGTQILSDIKYQTLAAVSGNKLLVNKKVVDLDLGTYGRPHIYKAGNKVYIIIANQDNHKIYAYDNQGNLLKNFPIIGQEILDFKGDKNSRYLLVYDNTKNLIVYKL